MEEKLRMVFLISPVEDKEGKGEKEGKRNKRRSETLKKMKDGREVEVSYCALKGHPVSHHFNLFESLNMFSNAAAYKNFVSNDEFINVSLAPAPVVGLLLNGLTGETKKKALVEYIEKKLESEGIQCVASNFQFAHTMTIMIKTQSPEIVFTLGNVNSVVEMLHFDQAETIKKIRCCNLLQGFYNGGTSLLSSFHLDKQCTYFQHEQRRKRKKKKKNSGSEARNDKEKGSERPGKESTKEDNKSTANHQSSQNGSNEKNATDTIMETENQNQDPARESISNSIPIVPESVIIETEYMIFNIL